MYVACKLMLLSLQNVPFKDLINSSALFSFVSSINHTLPPLLHLQLQCTYYLTIAITSSGVASFGKPLTTIEYTLYKVMPNFFFGSDVGAYFATFLTGLLDTF